MLQTESFGSVEISWIDTDLLLKRLRGLAQTLGERHTEVEQVLLFGSYATGRHNPESDVDLLIVVSDCTRPPLERADPYRDGFVDLPMDVNLLVRTREEVEASAGRSETFLSGILAQAVPLHLNASSTTQTLE